MKRVMIMPILIWALTLRAQVPQSSINIAVSKALPAVVGVKSFISDSVLNRLPSVALLGGFPRGTDGLLAGNASGVIISANGYIITNAHVLAGGDSIDVTLPDRRNFRAVLAGIDDAANLALLKIPVASLPYLQPVDPDGMHIGDVVLAVGNPLGLNSTVTAGILSGRYRGIDQSLTISAVNSFLQTDAAINEGMSGSALINSRGELIGINSAIVSATGAFSGYAFAVPASFVRKAYEDILKYNKVRHGCLDGVFKDMTAAQAFRLGINSTAGVMIDSLAVDGAGFRAGLRKDDVILKLNGKPLNFSAQLREWLALHDPGVRIRLTVQRASRKLIISAVLSENKDYRLLAQRSQHGLLSPTNGH